MSDEKKMYNVSWQQFNGGQVLSFDSIFLLTEDELQQANESLLTMTDSGRLDHFFMFPMDELPGFDELMESINRIWTIGGSLEG